MINLAVTPILKGTVPVDLSSSFNVPAIYKDGSKFSDEASADQGGYAFSAQTLGTEQIGAEVVFKLGPPNVPDAVASKTIPLPAGRFASLRILATAVGDTQARQVFTVNYADGTSSKFAQTLSDWAAAGDGDVQGQTSAVQVPYRVAGDGSTDGNPFSLFAYTFTLDPTKEVRSFATPTNRQVLVFAATLVPAGQ